jgi:hypothetical protein
MLRTASWVKVNQGTVGETIQVFLIIMSNQSPDPITPAFN